MYLDRQIKIVDILIDQKIVRVNELADFFEVSTMTIRRDLDFLEEKKIVNRIHGGAILQKNVFDDFHIQKIQHKENDSETIAIAENALDLIEFGDSIFLTASSINDTLASILPENYNLKVFTNSLTIANILKHSKGIKLYIFGGSYISSTNSLEGKFTVQDIKKFHYDKSFIGINGMKDNKIYTNSLMEKKSKLTAINNSKQSYAIINRYKIDREASILLCERNYFDAYIYSNEIDYHHNN